MMGKADAHAGSTNLLFISSSLEIKATVETSTKIISHTRFLLGYMPSLSRYISVGAKVVIIFTQDEKEGKVENKDQYYNGKQYEALMLN